MTIHVTPTRESSMSRLRWERCLPNPPSTAPRTHLQKSKNNQIKQKVSDKAFEKEIREIDKGIKKYDRNFIVPPGLEVSIEKENTFGQPCIYEQQVSCPTAHAGVVPNI